MNQRVCYLGQPRKIVKLLLLCSMLVSMGLTSHAQKLSKQEKRDSVINNSDYIFCGGGGGGITFRDENNEVYQILSFRITEVLRGPQELKYQTVYIIRKNYGVSYRYGRFEGGFNGSKPRPDEYEGGHSRFIFCKKSTFPEHFYTDTSKWWFADTALQRKIKEGALIIENTNFQLETSIYDNNNLKDEHKYMFKGMHGLKFKDKKDVYNFLQKYNNITVPERFQKRSSKKRGAGDDDVYNNSESRFVIRQCR